MGIMRYQIVIMGIKVIKVMKNSKDSVWHVTNIE